MALIALLAALIPVLGSPGACDTDYGQLRWDGYAHRFKAGGRTYELRGTLWDRDTNGVPSRGDLFRLDEVRINGEDAGAGELWIVVGRALGADMKRRFKRIAGQLTARCESRFEVRDVPRVNDKAGFHRFIRKQLGGGGGRGPSKDDRLAAAMDGWADQLCKTRKKHLSEKQLAARLVKRGLRRFKISKRRVRGIAREVAGRYAFACARLDSGIKL